MSDTVHLTLPISPNRLRALSPKHPIGMLRITSAAAQRGTFFGQKHAKALAFWPEIKEILLIGSCSKRALQILAERPSLRDLSIYSPTQHGKLGTWIAPSLRVFRSDFLSSSDVLALTDLSSLETLGLQEAGLSRKVVENLAQMPNLKSLDLERSNLGDHMMSALAKSKTITSLKVCATRINSEGLRAICAMSQLKDLDLWATDIRAQHMDMLQALPNLEGLSIGGHEGQTAMTAEQVLPRLANLKALKRLWLDGIPLTQSQEDTLQDQIEDLRIS